MTPVDIFGNFHAKSEPAGMHGIKGAPGSSVAQLTLFLFLSLYFVLLSFFIVLVGSSSYDKVRVAAASASVASLFGRKETGAPVVPDSRKDQVESLDGLFRAELPFVALKTEQGGTDMYADLPASLFFAEGGAELVPARAELLSRLARVLSSTDKSVRQEVVFLMDESAAPGETEDALAVLRAETLLQRMLAFGAPASSVRSGTRRAAGRARTPQLFILFRTGNAPADEEPAPEEAP